MSGTIANVRLQAKRMLFGGSLPWPLREVSFTYLLTESRFFEWVKKDALLLTILFLRR